MAAVWARPYTGKKKGKFAEPAIKDKNAEAARATGLINSLRANPGNGPSGRH